MINFEMRRSGERGLADHGWLVSRHSFSFADYYDPRHMGFRSLRVINEDRVAPGGGFPTHPHRDMEIFSYVVAGTLEHRDSLGTSRQLRPGQIQLMSAGSGVTHSEFNPSTTESLHFLQIWIHPASRGLAPRYTEWQPVPGADDRSKVLVISPDGRDGSATIAQDAEVYRLRIPAGGVCIHDLRPGRGLWLQIIAGKVSIGSECLAAGDAVSGDSPGGWEISAVEPTETLLFDLQ